MDPKSEKPLRLFVNPFTVWTEVALKTGHAMWASAYAAAARSNTAKVAVIPTADAPAPRVRNAKVAVLPAANAPRKARAPVRQASKAARLKTTRAKPRSKANAKRRARR
jgi:hypothetical protein